jgi:hypothetical protein
MTSLKHVFTSSTALDQARYDPETCVLDLWYTGGDRYRYFLVPPRVYHALIVAPSAGTFVNQQIKPRYRYEIEERRRRFRPRP